MSRVIAITGKDAVEFSVNVIVLLEKKGFHVRSLQEALSCIDVITSVNSNIEIKQSMRGCPVCHD